MTSVIRSLRDLVPIRPLTTIEAMRVAELQASRLLSLSGITTPAVPESVIANLPHVQVERMTPAPVSGATQWSRGRWLIVINGAQVLGRQRFSLAHEFKHALDNPFIDVLYPDLPRHVHHDRAEQICEYFAACLLMPRPWVKRAWTSGNQDLRRLAHNFEVSHQAMQVRLTQIGLVKPAPRCEYPDKPSRTAVSARQKVEDPLLAMLATRPDIDPAFLERLVAAKRSITSQAPRKEVSK